LRDRARDKTERAVRFVSHVTVGKPVRVEACDGTGACADWVRYPAAPPRVIVEVGPSRTGEWFFVWSKPDRKMRQLDLYRAPILGWPRSLPGEGLATRIAHLEPGFGGSLQWLESDVLFHVWGCGTGCSSARVYDLTGTTRFEETADFIDVSKDARRVVAVRTSGDVILFDGRTLGRFEYHGPSFSSPTDDARFRGDGVDLALGTDTLHCDPVPKGGLSCVP